MASNLRVDSIVPATGTNVSIGTATGGVNIPGVLTYEDVTNVDSIGIITARSGINGPSALSLKTGNNERLRITSDGHIEQTIGASNVGFDQVAAGDHYISNVINANRTTANDHIFIQRGLWNDKEVAAIKFRAGADTTNKDDGYITFETSSANNVTERLRIGSSGQIGIGGANYGTAGQVLTSQGASSAVQWATPSSGAMTLLATMSVNMSANTQSQALNLTGYQKLMGTVTSLELSGGLNDVWFGFNNMTSSGDFSWVRHYLDNSNDTSTNRAGTSTGYAYGSVGPGFFPNGAGFAGSDSGNNDSEFTVHNLQDGGRKIFEMHSRSFLTRNVVINTTGSINTTNAITSFEIHVAQASHRLTGGTVKLYGFK